MRSDTAEVLLAVDGVHSVDPDTLLCRLMSCEQNREYVKAISRGVNANERLCAVELLLRVAGNYCDTSNLMLSRTDKGKHYFSGETDIITHFSLSHTKDAVAVAVSLTHPVGVDIQTDDGFDEDKMLRVAKRFFSERELSQMDGAQSFKREFLRIWTCKEAVSKLYGTGQPHVYDMAQSSACFHSFSYDSGQLSVCFEGDAWVSRDMSPKNFWTVKR